MGFHTMVRGGIEIVVWIFYGLAIIFTITGIIMLVWKLTGHSPTELDLILWALGIIATFLVLCLTVLFQVSGKMGELLEFKRQTVEEIRGIKKRLEHIK